MAPSNITPRKAIVAHERFAFSQRLTNSLQNVLADPYSATELARAFNIRSEQPPITVHAARKWLLGEAIPTQEKLQALCRWLQINELWLRYGKNENYVDPKTHTPGPSRNVSLFNDIELLDPQALKYLRKTVDLLLQCQGVSRAVLRGAEISK